MRIEAFWAKGYRSLRDVRIEPLGPFNVFYGPNGSGKSNLLAAIHTLFRLVGLLGREDIELLRPSARPALETEAAEAAAAAVLAGVVQRRDLDMRSTDRTMVLGAIVASSSVTDLAIGNLSPERLLLEVTFDWFHIPLLWLSRVEIDGSPAVSVPERGAIPPTLELLRPLLAERLPSRLFGIVDAIRSLQREIDEVVERRESVNVLLKDLNEGRLASALFAAKNASSPPLRKRFKTLQTMLEGEPVCRPPFDVLRDVDTKEISVRERLSSLPDEEREVPLDLAGLGVVQLYAILAKIIFSETAAVAVEEPEAHLHAPTSGLHLRHLLQRLVAEQHVQQLFIATHSNLFDLDPAGYFDVSLDAEGATVVERRPLRDLDRHFYEPGPTLHALEELMSVVPADKVMFRRSDGAPVTAAEMAEMLRAADPVALDYLRTLHGATVDVVGLRSRKVSRT